MILQILDFWNWFQEQSNRLGSMSDTDRVADEIYAHISLIDPNLAVEVSTVDSLGHRELIISASGDDSLFPLVMQVGEKSVRCSGWTVTLLKPPRGFSFYTTADGITISPSNWRFIPLQVDDKPERLGIRLITFSEYTFGPDALSLILQAGIGEEATAYLECLESSHQSQGGTRDLSIDRLGEYIRWHKQKYDRVD